MRNMKKAFAFAVSAAMVAGMSVPALADTTVDNGGSTTSDVTAPIYSLDIDKVVVPSAYQVAFNPGELTVTTGTGSTSTDQILSRNFGIINQSSKAKIVTVSLNVEDLNKDADNNDKIKFVGSSAEIGSAAMDDYAVYLEAVPADATEVTVGTTPASADENTAAADLGNVNMTGATGASVPLSAGDNELQFVLGKATYTPIKDSEVTLGTSGDNNVASNYELTGLAADGKGITAFTLTGSMNKTAEWHKLTEGIKITPTYTLETVADEALAADSGLVKSGTGAVYESPVVQFTSKAVGKIRYTKGTGDDALKSISKVEMTLPNGGVFDGYNRAANGRWDAATDVNGVITFHEVYFKTYQDALPNDTTLAAKVTYTTEGGETKTATVDVKLK